MFTATELEFLKALLNAQIINGDYQYYVAYTLTSVTSTTENYDFYVVLSEMPITATGKNTFKCDGKQVIYKVDSSSSSRTNYDDRIIYSEQNARTFNVDSYEFIYTNALDSVHGDLIALQTYEIQNNLMFNLNKNEYYVSLMLLGVLILSQLFRAVFPNWIGD